MKVKLQGKWLRIAILLLLDEHQRADSSHVVNDTEITWTLGVSSEDVRRQFDILEEQDLINTANTFGGHCAYISTKGKALADEFRNANEAEEPTRRISDSTKTVRPTGYPAPLRISVCLVTAT